MNFLKIKWTAKRIWFKHYVIIIVFTFLLTFIIEPLIELSENSLLWMSSTVIQAFGALIAVTIAIGIFEKERIERNIERIIYSALGDKVTKIEPRFIGQQLEHPHKKYYLQYKQREKKIWQLIFYPIQSIVLIIGLSLVTIMLIDSSFLWTNYGLVFTFIAIILLSMYTLEKLLLQVKDILNPSKK